MDFGDLVFDNSSGFQIVPPPSWYDQVIDEVGFTGSYVGQVWNGAQTAHAYLQLVDVGGLALGYVHLLEDEIELDGGWCGTEPLPHVRFPITASTSGPVPYGLPTIDQSTAVGVTTRQASLFGVFGGTAVLSFELTLDVTATHDSFLTASIDIDAPSPCDDQHPTGSFTRNNAALFEAFVIR